MEAPSVLFDDMAQRPTRDIPNVLYANTLF